jgi:UDP-N-acetylglucosamine 2-epimerase (non-hydrolysing)
MKIFNIVGARPNFMKIAPLMEAMGKSPDLQPNLIHTGQHYDEKMSKIIFNEIGLPKPAVDLGIGSGSQAEQTAKIMIAPEKLSVEYSPDLVLVVGDVNSTLACSLVAAKLGIRLAHVEADLRSRDRTMPEEINRLVTDTLADWLFTTSKDANENMKAEGVPEEKIFLVGNVMEDTLLKHRQAASQLDILTRLGLNGKEKHYAVMTLHRPANVDNVETLSKLLEAVEVIQQEIPLVFPVHPRTYKQIESLGLRAESDADAAVNSVGTARLFRISGRDESGADGVDRFGGVARGDDRVGDSVFDVAGEYGTAGDHLGGDEYVSGDGSPENCGSGMGSAEE